jgi:hypothetical protein
MIGCPRVGRRGLGGHEVHWDRLSSGERLVGVSGVSLFVVSFLPWLGGRISAFTINGRSFPTSKYQFTHPAWGFAITLIAVVAGVMLVAAIALKAAGTELSGWPGGLTEGRLFATLGGLAFVLILAKVLVGADVTTASFSFPSTAGLGATLQVTVVKTRSFGAYAGVVTSAGLAAGGVLIARAERA